MRKRLSQQVTYGGLELRLCGFGFGFGFGLEFGFLAEFKAKTAQARLAGEAKAREASARD